MKHLTTLLLILIPPCFGFSQMKNVIIEAKEVPKPFTRDAQIDAWNRVQPNFSTLSEDGKSFFYWTNFSRANPRRFWDSVVVPILKAFPNLRSNYTESLKSDLYSETSLPLLKLNTTLMKTASAHAIDICSHHAQPGHSSTDGRTFSERITAAGIKNCGGENISLGDVDPILSLVLLYIDYGVTNLGHRKALLNPSYVETGIGVSTYGNDGSLFIVEDFCCSQPPPKPTL